MKKGATAPFYFRMNMLTAKEALEMVASSEELVDRLLNTIEPSVVNKARAGERYVDYWIGSEVRRDIMYMPFELKAAAKLRELGYTVHEQTGETYEARGSGRMLTHYGFRIGW